MPYIPKIKIGSTTYDVKDSKAWEDVDILDTLVNGTHSYINYDYNTPYERKENTSASGWAYKVGCKRDKMLVVLNKSTLSQYDIRIKLSGNVAYAATSSTIEEWTTGVTLKEEHEYRIAVKLVSGSSSTSRGEGYVPIMSVYRTGESSTVGNYTVRTGYSERVFTAEANVSYNFILYIGSEGTYFTDAKLLITLEDMTESDLASLESNVAELKDALFHDENVEYEVSDWRLGYYAATTGEYTSSYLYICTSNTFLVNDPSVNRITASVPEGRSIGAFEYTSNGEYVGRYGNIKNGPNSIDFACTEGNYYRFAVGRFPNNTAENYLTSEFISQINTIICRTRIPSQSGSKKERTGDFEFFTVKVDRPIAFDEGSELTTSRQTIECVLRLPSTYDRYGTPTRLILACHGAHGYISSSSTTWYNSNWKEFMDALLEAGYAVFDANIFPTSTGTDQMGYAVGSPLYVSVLKKAYDYIQANYNVYEKIFAHGTSMGGVGATAFSHAYPSLVLAESSFAGRDVLRYLIHLEDGTADDERFAISYGYDSLSDLADDKFSHCEGCFPSLSLVKYVDGIAQIPPDRETNYQNWLTYLCQIANLERNDDAGIWMGCRSVPYKAWNSWADNVAYTKLQTILKKAYNRGNSCPYYVVNYESGTHTEMSYGQINDMIPQLIAWYKRWE